MNKQCSISVYPKVIPADTETIVKFSPVHADCAFEDSEYYDITCYPTEQYCGKESSSIRKQVKPSNGILELSHQFFGEQEHVLVVEKVESNIRQFIGECRIYSVGDDLFCRKPYKGDTHLHSCHSDGKETPPYISAECRKIGLDFMAITDHGKYYPSIEAQDSFRNLELDFRIFPGEEIHPPDNRVHIVNFGGNFSVNQLFSDDSYRKEVSEIGKKLPRLPKGVDVYEYASAVWCFDKIREAGGLGVFCHPYWFTHMHYEPSAYLTSLMLQEQPFDALELLGGYLKEHVYSNVLQVGRYWEEQAKGRSIPIVGASDAHGCDRKEPFGWYYTIVFAPSLALSDIIDSIKDLYSVAVEAIPGESIRVYGRFPLIKYALFLIREVFPRHDQLCQEEGQLMHEYLAGHSDAIKKLSDAKEKLNRFYVEHWRE